MEVGNKIPGILTVFLNATSALRVFALELGVPFARKTGIINLSRRLPQIEHLYGLTVFENYLYATNSDEGNLNPKTSVIRVNRFNSSDFQVVTRVDRGAALHVYHQRRQPQGTHPPNPDSTLRCFWSLMLALLSPGLVRSHACALDQFEKAGGCSDICLLGNSHKTRTCRCRSGFSLGSDGKSCKSECLYPRGGGLNRLRIILTVWKC